MKELHIPYTLKLNIRGGTVVTLTRELNVDDTHPLAPEVWPATQKIAAAYLGGDYQDSDSAYLLWMDLEEAMSLDLYRHIGAIRQREKNATPADMTGFYTGATELGVVPVGEVLVKGHRINPRAVVDINVSVDDDTGDYGEDDEWSANPDDYEDGEPWD